MAPSLLPPRMLPPRLLLLAGVAPLLALAACDRADKEPSMTITAGDNASGSLNAAAGEVKLDLPGFSGQFQLPKLKLDANDFELNGVHLYPGSTIDGVNVAAKGKDGGVRIRFTSPANADTVRGWFQDRLSKAGFTLRADGNGLAGTTEEKKPFRLDLDTAGGNRSSGTIVLGG